MPGCGLKSGLVRTLPDEPGPPGGQKPRNFLAGKSSSSHADWQSRGGSGQSRGSGARAEAIKTGLGIRWFPLRRAARISRVPCRRNNPTMSGISEPSIWRRDKGFSLFVGIVIGFFLGRSFGRVADRLLGSPPGTEKGPRDATQPPKSGRGLGNTKRHHRNRRMFHAHVCRAVTLGRLAPRCRSAVAVS